MCGLWACMHPSAGMEANPIQDQASAPEGGLRPAAACPCSLIPEHRPGKASAKEGGSGGRRAPLTHLARWGPIVPWLRGVSHRRAGLPTPAHGVTPPQSPGAMGSQRAPGGRLGGEGWTPGGCLPLPGKLCGPTSMPPLPPGPNPPGHLTPPAGGHGATVGMGLGLGLGAAQALVHWPLPPGSHACCCARPPEQPCSSRAPDPAAHRRARSCPWGRAAPARHKARPPNKGRPPLGPKHARSTKPRPHRPHRPGVRSP